MADQKTKIQGKRLRLVGNRTRQVIRLLLHGPKSHNIQARRLPYPVSIKRRNTEAESVPAGGGSEAFDNAEAIEINRARLAHLESLGLPLEGKRVLDVGCGVGHLAQFFVAKGCKIACLDARLENIDELHQRYSTLEAYVANVETESLLRLGTFDIIFAYGLLYHLENPLVALRNMASVSRELLLLETMICDSQLPVLRFEDESSAFNQALHGLACRPSPSWVVQALNRIGFQFIYAPDKPPNHRDFQIEWRNNLDWWRENHPLRCVFVASRTELHNPRLVQLLGADL